MALVDVTGIIIKSSDYGEYDRRLVLLTMERGKITVFAKGVKRPGNRNMAQTEPFAFGKFTLMEGKNAYSFREAEIQRFFEELRSDIDAYYTGCFFLEVADYYARENSDDSELLKLLYTSLLALVSPALDNRLIRHIFIIKAIIVNGEFPGLPAEDSVHTGTMKVLRHIVGETQLKLFNIAVSDEVLEEISYLSRQYMDRCINHRFRTLDFVED